VAEAEARVAALTLALKYKREIDRLRALSGSDHAETVRAGRINGTANGISGDALADRQPGTLQIPRSGRIAEQPCVVTSVAERVTGELESRPKQSVMSLVEVWQRVALPRAARTVQQMRRRARLFADTVDHVGPREVTREHVMRFRDVVEGMPLSHRTATQYLESIHRLFAVALSEGLVDHNPAGGIKIRKVAGKFADHRRRRPFEPHQVRAIFAAMSDEPLAFRWIVKVCAYHGMRSGEVTQLRSEDVTTLFGVPVLRVHDRFGSIKNRFSQRDIPLHPRCEEFIDYARAVRGPWLFEPLNWRSDRFQRYASVFLRTKAALTDRTLTMHSLRHTWRTLAREIGMPASVSRAIMGHAMGRDVHEAYGGGPSLRLMADWMARIDPLAG
jgi:integrase